MSPIERSVIERKLDSIRTNLTDVRSLIDKGIESYVKNGLDRKVMERSLQLVIEAAVDINLHVLRERFELVPDDSTKSFGMMAQNGILSIELAEALAPSVGLRNRIVHEYDVLDAEKVFLGAEKALKLFPRYTAAILSLLGD